MPSFVGKVAPMAGAAIVSLCVGHLAGVRLRQTVDAFHGCEGSGLARAEADLSWMAAGKGMKVAPEDVPQGDFTEQVARYQKYLAVNELITESPVEPDYVVRPSEFDGLPDVAAQKEVVPVGDESCFLEGECARRYSCVRPQVAPAGGQPMCMDFLRGPDGGGDTGCVAYSFSLGADLGWERRVLEQTPCDVFLLNPDLDPADFQALVTASGLTVEQQQRMAHRSFGLEGMLPADASDEDREEKEKSFGLIKQELGHTRRVLQLVRIHCGGCELRLLEINAMNKPFRMVRQLAVRFFKSEMKAPGMEATAKSAFQMLHTLVERQDFELVHHEFVAGNDPEVKDVDITFIMPRW